MGHQNSWDFYGGLSTPGVYIIACDLWPAARWEMQPAAGALVQNISVQSTVPGNNKSLRVYYSQYGLHEL